MYAHDPTKLFAGIASRARQIFGVKADQIHVDTTSFSVSGEYAAVATRTEDPTTEPAEETGAEAIIAITYGYSRDHREDLRQWMLALATTHDGDIPLLLRPLDGNSGDKKSLLSAVTALQDQLRTPDGEASIYVADNGIYSEANMRQLNEAGVKWVSRVSETTNEAKMVLNEGCEEWRSSEDGTQHWCSRRMSLSQGEERLSSWFARWPPNNEHKQACNDRPVKPRGDGNRSAGTLAIGASPAKLTRRWPWSAS